jgi:hypothetical protein
MALEIQSYDQGVATGAMAKVSDIEWPEGLNCPRLRFEVTVEVKNDTAGALDYTFARAKLAAACLFGFVSNWWGKKSKEIFDNAITLAQLRELIVNNTDDDLLINGSFWGDLTDATVLQAAVAAGASFNLVIEVPRPFELTKLGADAPIWAAGPSQMRLFHSEIKRLSPGDFDSNGNFVQNAAAHFMLLGDTGIAHDDNWANVPRVYVNQEVGKINHAPAGELLLTGAWERTKTGTETMAGAAGTLGFVSVRRAGDAPLHENIKAARIARDSLYSLRPGQVDLNPLACPLVTLPQDIAPNDLPAGAGFIIEMPGAEIAGGASVAWAYLPAFDDGYAETYVAPNLVGKEKGMPKRVKLVQSLSKQGRSVTSTLAHFSPRSILDEGDSDYRTAPGMFADADSAKLIPDVPEHVAAAAKAAASSGKDQEQKQAIAVQAGKQVSKFLTGFTTARRRRTTGARRELTGAISSGAQSAMFKR